MSNDKKMPETTRNASTTTPTSAEPESGKSRREGYRETIESIVIAFVFAFLFRTFEAEAFVIPTGSMAPTLLGRHKDAQCPSCGFEFPVGASEELDRETGTLLVERLNSAVCPNCRFRLNLKDDPVFAGDRILVTKFNHQIGEPDRWDVTVFKYPEDPTTNYIKRLVGLPGETLEIRQGDVYRLEKAGPAAILHKQQSDKQLAVLQTVYDDSHPAEELLAAGWPERWAAVRRESTADAIAGWTETNVGWQADREQRSYRVAAGNQPRWLRYRHFVPTRTEWAGFADGEEFIDPRPRLILDFCGYNALSFEHSFRPIDEGAYWVGDLAVSTSVDLEEIGRDALLMFELVEGNRRYRCQFDPAAGKAVLSYIDSLDRELRDDAARVLSEAAVPILGPGQYEIVFANVDDRLRLWIDGEEILFPKAAYEPYGGQLIQTPSVSDLVPVGISAKNLTLTVSNLLLSRDVYYRSEMVESQGPGGRDTFHLKEVGSEVNEDRLADLAEDPAQYAEFYATHASWLTGGPTAQFDLSADEFLMLGDNSPRSLDGRLWSNTRGNIHRYAVPRGYLVGKALLIFWPHGLRLGNEQDGVAHGWTVPLMDRFFYHQTANGQLTDYPAYGVPFYPDFERIFRRIR